MPSRRPPTPPSRELECAIEQALAPGRFVGYRENGALVDGVEAVRARIAPLIRKGDAPQAVALIETFIAGCYEKSDEIDDSDGSFGMFVESLFCDWIRARQAAKADEAETAGKLLAWMEGDEYGYCHGLEKRAVEVLDKAGLAAFEEAVHADAARSRGAEKADHRLRRSVEILKAIHEARHDVDAYAALCDAEADLAPADCQALAELCLHRRRREDALAWVVRGLELERTQRGPIRSAWRLADLKREILQKLGRNGDALASAWEDYTGAPSVYSYEDLMKFVPRGERAAWHAKAIAALDGVDLMFRMDILVKTKEVTQLAADVEATPRAKLVALSHSTTEPAAACLEKSHPLLAAKLHVAMALRVLEAKKSKYYDAALRNMRAARRLMLQEGRDREWVALSTEVRAAHGRKHSFIYGFDRIEVVVREPSFLQRARERWGANSGGAS